MKAFILAAGLGTRLKPLTNDRPKALVNIGGKPMIEHILLNLRRNGFSDIVVNIHHHAESFRKYLETLYLEGITISISDESAVLMDTGGAILHARHLLGDDAPFLVQNVDIISNIAYSQLADCLINHKALASLAVRKRTTTRSLLVDADMHLCGWKNHETGEVKICYDTAYQELAFSGIHVMSPEVFSHMPKGPFSIIEFYLQMAREGRKIKCHLHQDDFWLDLGRYEQIPEAEAAIRTLGWI